MRTKSLSLSQSLTSSIATVTYLILPLKSNGSPGMKATHCLSLFVGISLIFSFPIKIFPDTISIILYIADNIDILLVAWEPIRAASTKC